MGTIRSGRVTLACVFIVVGAFSVATRGWAHPDLEAQIARITAELAGRPKAAELFLQRADLYRRHAQYDEALRDIDVAARLKTDSPQIILARAKVFSEAGRTEEALEAARQFLAVATNHWEGFLICARACQKLNQSKEAIQNYTAAITNSPAPEPDLFLERARAQAASGDFEPAVAGLDEGMKKLGNIPSLELPTIEFEQQRKNFPGALVRLDKIIARYPVKDPWLVLRGKILEQAGRFAEARETFQKVLVDINDYPPARRTLEMTKQLEARAHDGLARVEANLASSPNSQPANLPSALNQTP